MWFIRVIAAAFGGAGMGVAALTPAFGQNLEVHGAPVPWQMGFQEAATPVMAQINSFHNFLVIISTAIALFVLVIMAYVMIRFRASKNPTPSRTTHNTALEIIWTIVPIVILVVIAVPSFRVLYFMDRAVDAEMTIKAIGNQWYWTYEYPDDGDFVFDAIMLEDDEIGEGQIRLLETDTHVVVPVDTTIRLLVTASDVLHAWAIPAFGVKMDAVPGRINETWFRVEKQGIYYGQCSELCGIHHGFMPIVVEAVSKERYAEWVKEAQEKYAAIAATGETKLAAQRLETQTD